ncbi:hypothetical protein PPYR_04530 [Photinus pyralis]|uniref:Peroxidase n=1 Tax=Photinus pyralis TaxID=7054 RepID=A0A5N4AYD0_PHOPY|nr:peroxidase [Photinus pyralis]KAB0802344.1 hypothetical protein PPYR_04530 [Photinus pyralis]
MIPYIELLVICLMVTISRTNAQYYHGSDPDDSPYYDNYVKGFFHPSFPGDYPSGNEELLEPETQCNINPICTDSNYRTYDGSCNNPVNPTWGAAQTTFTRLLPPNYADGISAPPVAKSGKVLPLARVVSLTLFPDIKKIDPRFTLALMQYGQIITHDMDLIAGSTQSTPHSTRCCTDDGQILSSTASIPTPCFAILLPEGDPQSLAANKRCMNFVRTITNRDRNCVDNEKPAEQITTVSHFLDLSLVYGNTLQVNQQIRQFQGGRLLASERNGQSWLPQNNNVSAVCSGALSPNEPCYLAGDLRVNQNPQLTLLQTVLMREHNRLADALAQLNPHWDDETIFQEARQINIAQHQHVTYYEYLPLLLGVTNSLKNGLAHENHGDYVNDYSESVDPTIINEHATSAFRFFHNLIVGFLNMVTEHREVSGTIRLSDWFNRPAVLEQGDTFDALTRSLSTQPQRKSTQFVDSEVTQFLFRTPRQQFGSDLKATDIQRGRDHGLASYNDIRVFCGLRRAHTFEDFLDVISPENVEKLAALYEHPDDVELNAGGAVEVLVPGTLVGPVNLCILTEQFYRTRVGDRFFYENGAPKTGPGFSLGQLNEIRKASFAGWLCDNGNNVQLMQPRAFEAVSESNPLTPCETLPSIDLSLWKEGQGLHSWFT